MSAIAQRRAVFAAVLAAYHNDFSNVAEGVRHSAQFIRNALALDEAAAKAALQADPRLTSTDGGAVAIGIAKMVATHEKASKSFIDVEIGESAYLVSFDADVQPQQAISIVSPLGNVAQLCKPGDKLGEDIVSDILILACEPAAPVVEAMVEDAKEVIAERADVVENGDKPVHVTTQLAHGDNVGSPYLVHDLDWSAASKFGGKNVMTAKANRLTVHKFASSKDAAGFVQHVKDVFHAYIKPEDISMKESTEVAESADDGYENPEHEHFTALAKVPKYNGPVNTFTAHGGGNRMHAFMRSGGRVTKQRAAVLAGYHADKAKEHDTAWNAAADKASQEHFGRPFGFGDYKVSGVGREEFSDVHKDTLRQHAQLASKHRALATMFSHAARYSKMTESDETCEAMLGSPHVKAIHQFVAAHPEHAEAAAKVMSGYIAGSFGHSHVSAEALTSGIHGRAEVARTLRKIPTSEHHLVAAAAVQAIHQPLTTPDNIVRSTTEAKSADKRAKAASDAAVAKAKAKKHVREHAEAVFAYAYGDAALAKLDESKRGDLALAHMMRVFGTGEVKAETGVAKFDAVLAKALAARKINESADAFGQQVDDLAFAIYDELGAEVPALAEATIDDNAVGAVVMESAERLRGIARLALMGAGVVAPTVAESFEALVAHIKAAVTKKATP